MIISNNHKIVVLGVPKTGTRTIKNILAPYSISLSEHDDYSIVMLNAVIKIPGFSPSEVEKVYVFWRDPVKRFISAVNYFRSPKHIQFLIRHKPQWFNGIDLSAYTTLYNKMPYGGMPPFPPIPQEVIDQCLVAAEGITPEQIFADELLMTMYTAKQKLWHKYAKDKLIVLDFANFEENLRRVAIDFGAPADIVIPKLNESRKLTTSLSPELEAAVREHYAEDYALKPK